MSLIECLTLIGSSAASEFSKENNQMNKFIPNQPSSTGMYNYAMFRLWQWSISSIIASNFGSYVSSLPPAVRPLLEKQLDWDNNVDADLKEIAQDMEDWDLKLATHLKLSERDASDINRKYYADPTVQRWE